MVRWQRLLATPCMYCSGPQVSSWTMPHARSNAHWLWMNTPSHSANAGIKKESHWESHVSVVMLDRQSSAISQEVASSITRLMAIPSTLQHDWKSPTSNSAHVSASARPWLRGWNIFGADLWGTFC